MTNVLLSNDDGGGGAEGSITLVLKMLIVTLRSVFVGSGDKV